MLAAGADEQVGIGNPGRHQRRLEPSLVDLLGAQVAVTHLPRQMPRGARDLLAPAVADREQNRHAVVVARAAFDFAQLVENVGREPAQIADGAEPDAVAHHTRHFAAQIALEKPHQSVYFPARSLPVLARKRIQGQVLDADLPRRLDDCAHGVLAPAVSLNPAQPACLGPATVAVHDDRDVAGKIAARCRFAGGHGVRPTGPLLPSPSRSRRSVRSPSWSPPRPSPGNDASRLRRFLSRRADP